MAEAVRKEYETSLADLTFNSKPLINMLTMLAEENVKHAREIVQVIETRLQKAKPSEKLPTLYLTDSIIKNMRGAYLEAFAPNIIHTFCGVFEKVDEKTRQALFKLRMTWSSYFSPKKLYALDLKVQELDPAWPIVADPTASQPAAIHVNPKFIKKQSQTTGAPKTSTTTSKPTTSSTSIKLSALELAERKKKESERQEIEMRQQLIKKQEQLLQLQQKRLEFELQQTQSKLAVQALELKQKNEELIHQQQALQHQQQQAAAQQQQAAAAAAAAAVASWSPAMPPRPAMLPPPQPPMMWPSGPPRPPIMPGYEAPRMQQQAFLPPPPVPPFNLGQPPSMPQQQPTPPMQPVLPVQQVPPVPQAMAPVNRDPRVARDPRLARRDPRLRGAPQLPASAPAPQTAPAVATVPPVQSTAQTPVVSVAPPKSKPPATSTKPAPSETTQKLKSIVTVASSQPSVTPSKSSVQVASVVQVAKTSDSKQPPVEKQESKSETKANKKDTASEKKKTNSKVSSEPSLLAQFKMEVEEKLNKSKEAKEANEAKSSERSPRRDEERDVGSDSKSRDRSSREPERRSSKDSKKDFDKRDSWSKDRDSREKDRDYRPREIAKPVNSRRRANRSRSRSRSPVSRRSHSPRSDKSRTAGNKVDRFGRDIPRPVKEDKEEKKVEPARKDIDERPKARRSSKENVLDIKDDKVPKSEKRPSPSRMSDKETESKSAEEAPSKRRRLDEETPAKRKASSLSPPKTVPEREREKLSKDKRHEDELGSLRSKKSAEELRTLKELGPLHLGGKHGLGRDRRHPWDRVEYERELLSPSGRREKPLLRRRWSIDPGVHIPKELSYEKHSFILEQAEKQLHSGELTHQQHQELLRELYELHEIQRQRKEEEFVKRHPEDPHLKRHFLDDPGMGYDPRRRLDPRKEGSWAQEKDIDRRRFPAQDIDMRVFDSGHPAHGPTGKTKNEHPEFEPISDEEIPLPSEDKDERTRNPVQQDRDDRVRVSPMAPNQNETKLLPPPLKSILKTRKPVPLDSPLSPEPSEKCGNDSKVKTDGEETTTSEEKETDVDVKEESEKIIDSMYSPVSDSPDDVLAEDAPLKDVDQQSVEKGKSKKKTKKKKKKGKGEAEVVVEISAFEENLQIKPPIFNEKKKQPLMDMDERRNSTDNEAGDVLPAPFREADDIGDLFPSGGDRDERRGHESSGDSSKEAPPSSPKRKAQDEGHSRENIAATDQFKEAHHRDPRVSKGPADIDHRPPGDGYREGFPERDQRSRPYRGRHTNELPSREGVFREPPPRDSAFHEGSPRESLLRDRPPRSPSRENESWGDPRLGPIREDRFGEGLDRDGSPREGPFKEGPPREDHFRDYQPRDGPFREGPPREVQFRGPPREGSFREGSFREGPPREGPFRGPPRDDQFRESPPREGPFREGPPREGSFRGPPREGLFRQGPPREGPFREGPPRDGPFREGPPREGSFREGPPREGSFREGPPREGSFREGPPREGPPREGPSREGSPREGSFREGPPRDGPFWEGPPRESSFREGPPREGSFREGLQREGSFREGPPREDSFREGPPREGPFRDGPPREGSFRDVHPRDPRGHPRGPYREENEFRDGPFREGSRREEPFWDDRPREGYARGSPPPRTDHFRDFPPSEVGPRRSPPRDQFRGPPGPLEERRDGPTHDMRERRFQGGPDEAGPRPMMEHDPAKGPPPDRLGEEQRGMPASQDLSKPPPMGDKDERHPRQFNENAPMRHPMQPIPDRPNMEATLPPPHLQGPPRHTVLGMAPLTMVPVQALTQVSGVGHIPTNMQGPHLLNVSQPGQVLVLQGQQGPVFVPQVPHQLPPGFQPLIRPGLELRPQFDPSVPPPGFPQVLPVSSGMLNPIMQSAPHLRPENPQGTPPQQQAGPFNINSLFAKLVATGILPPTRSDSPALPGTGTPPPTTAAPESTEPEEPAPGDYLFVPEIGLYPEELKCRYQGVINRIYTGAQCSSCGMRYVIDDMDRYRKHLDWHFRQNRREKDGVKAVQNRKWFYDVDEWLNFEEINEVDEERSNFFEEQSIQSQVDKDGVQCVAVDANLEGDEMCKLCHEPFEQFFDEDEEVWMLKDAVRFKNRTFHPSCYEDAKESALLETPTPGEEGLNSSFESLTSSPLSAYAQRKMAKTGQTTSTGQSSDSSKEEPNEPVAKSGHPVEDSKIGLSENSGPALDQPKVDTNQQTASTKVELPSTDQSVDPQEDTKLSTESPSLGTQPIDAKSQIVDSAPIIKAETSGALETNPQLVTDQPMDTRSSAEIQQSIKQEHTADDASVKTETLVSLPVKMEVDESTIAKRSQDLAPEEKMEVSESVLVKQESEPVDSVQPMDTSEGVSSADANLKREASNELPETKLKSELDETNAQASSEPDHTCSKPLVPTSNPVEITKQEQTGLEPLAPESSKTESGKTETESLNPHPKAEIASSEMEKEDGATSLGQEVQETSSQQAKSEIIPDTEHGQSETKETEAGSQDSGNVEQKPSQETPADGDANSTPTTTAATASEVQNIQAISVIGRSRLETRRRDMFFR